MSMPKTEMLFHHGLDVVYENGKYRPRRFTEKQTEALSTLNEWFGQSSRAVSGIAIKCYTEADVVSFAYALLYTTKRTSGFDVYENGVLVYHETLPLEDTTEAHFVYRKQTAGLVLLEIVLPGAAEMHLWDLDFGIWQPVDDSQKPLVLWYGDSITQSTTVEYPSLTFAALSSRLADREYVNRGIGSLYFDESVLDEADPLCPAVIVVEFGSNDLVKHGADRQVVYVDGEAQYCTAADVPALMEKAGAYLEKLCRIYPGARILVLSMLWHWEDMTEDCRLAELAYRAALEKLVGEMSLGFIDGLAVMPHLEMCCVGDKLHLSTVGSVLAAQAIGGYLQ